MVDTKEDTAWTIAYDFNWCVAGDPEVLDTRSLPRDGATRPHAVGAPALDRDVPAGGYAALTERSKEEFACGNLFEVVLSQQWSVPAEARPSAVFRTLRRRNPSPYGFLMNLRGEDAEDAPAWAKGYGKGEYLVGASPEMFVRVERVDGSMRVETCPISGTIQRGENALEDAVQVRTLLASKKDESELTMCTDVDRNDKSRICEPGSVAVIGRRQIEMSLSPRGASSDESRRRRGCDVDISWETNRGDVAAARRGVRGGRTREGESVAGTYGLSS